MISVIKWNMVDQGPEKGLLQVFVEQKPPTPVAQYKTQKENQQSWSSENILSFFEELRYGYSG